MPAAIANIVLLVAGTYAALGIVFAVAFVSRGVSRVDHAADHAPWSFRLIILPGVAALWPLLLVRWLGAGKGRP